MAVVRTAPRPSARAPERAGFLERLRPVEILLLLYVAIVSAVAIARAAEVPACWWLLVAHALIVALMWLTSRPDPGPIARAVREIYPLALLVALYAALDVLNAAATTVHDALIQRWELALFGEQVSRLWWQRHPSAFWSTVLHGAYLSYYLILSVPALWFAVRRDFVALRRFVFTVMATFCVCYLFFIFLPVAGPYYVFPRPSGPFVDNAMARLVYDALARGSSYGAAFPSSHVAATVAATIATARGSRTAGLVLLVPAVLLTVAVVYCQMHYAVDAIAGILVGGSMAGITLAVERRGAPWAR